MKTRQLISFLLLAAVLLLCILVDCNEKRRATTGFMVEKAANVDRATVGDTVLFSIGISNGTPDTLLVGIDDTLPPQFQLVRVGHNCARMTITVDSKSIHAEAIVPARTACQLFVEAVVVSACNCYVENVAVWGTIKVSGKAHSQPIYLGAVPPTQDPYPAPVYVPVIDKRWPQPTAASPNGGK